MSNGTLRPGGLTALAICNFVFGGLAGLQLLSLVALLTIAPQNARNSPGMPSDAMLIAMLILGGVAVVLLIVSGIGYLMTRKFLGRYLGTFYGVFAIGNSVFGIVAFTSARGDVGLLHLVGIIYPVLTIILLNTTFRHDFSN